MQDLEKSFKQLTVLRSVDLEAARGSVFVLPGSNGAGKTTLTKILSTLLKADAGSARVNGFNVVKQAPDVRSCTSSASAAVPAGPGWSGWPSRPSELRMLPAHLDADHPGLREE